MSKTVSEVLESIRAKEGKNGKVVLNRFNKKSFNALMTAMANDPEFTERVVKVKKGEIDGFEDIMVSIGFREFCKKIAEKAGVDKVESARILTDSFEFSQADLSPLYDFFVSAVYEYMQAGNRFDFLPTEDFKASISIKNVEEKTTRAEAFSPKDRTSLGIFETTKKAHKELSVKTGCPSFLKNRKKV